MRVVIGAGHEKRASALFSEGEEPTLVEAFAMGVKVSISTMGRDRALIIVTPDDEDDCYALAELDSEASPRRLRILVRGQQREAPTLLSERALGLLEAEPAPCEPDESHAVAAHGVRQCRVHLAEWPEVDDICEWVQERTAIIEADR